MSDNSDPTDEGKDPAALRADRVRRRRPKRQEDPYVDGAEYWRRVYRQMMEG
jgi:hypothetical protein